MLSLPTTMATRVAAFTALAWTLACFGVGCGAPSSASSEGDAEVAALHDEGLLGNGLTRAQVQTVLKLIDDLCGDIWCEGDHAFRFRYLFCDTSTGMCTLLLQMALRTDGQTPLAFSWETCRTSGFLGFDSLVNTSSGGYQWLTNTYYDALNHCIGALPQPAAEPR